MFSAPHRAVSKEAPPRTPGPLQKDLACEFILLLLAFQHQMSSCLCYSSLVFLTVSSDLAETPGWRSLCNEFLLFSFHL